eukprot:TRINITY_DN26248_c0_g2_i1.p1 TRINITY_DN26248_c0_g2~~TRINITY_DN26248_c0_g2_i1.p1  ORF type:complete len:1316 (+),score=276.63 TRINITY_DN26248_c0_g2_i1:26-3973(+)
MAAEADVSIELIHAFGSLCGSNVRDAVLFADDTAQQIAFPVGRRVCISHVDNAEASFVASERTEQVTAMAVAQDRSYLAVCEKGVGESWISILDLRSGTSKPMKTIKPLSAGASGARLLSCAFSAPQEGGTSRYLCTVTSGSEPTVIVMNWESEKVLAKCKVPGAAERVAFCIKPEGTEISVSGPHMFRLLHLRSVKGEQVLKAMPAFSGLDEKSVRILDHAWLESSKGIVAVCIAEGQVHLVSTEELLVVRTISKPFGDGEDAPSMPQCVRSFSQGFLIGGADGYIALWEQTDDETFVDGSQGDSEAGGQRSAEREHKHANTVQVRQSEAAVFSLDLTSGEESLLIGFRDANMGIISMGSLYATKDEEVSCSIIGGGNHSGPITGLDVAVQRPLVASVSSKDSTVRIWNYSTRICEIRADFGGDAPSSIALHPFGYYLAISFAGWLRFYHILVNDLKLHQEQSVRGIKLLKFSNGGHLLAAAQGKLIQIFSSSTLLKLATLQGHTKEVTGMTFDHEDSSLWSIGEDGRLLEWDTSTWQQVRGLPQEENLELLAVGAMAPGAISVSVQRGSKSFIQSVQESKLEHEKELSAQAKLQVVCHFPGSPVLFAGTDKGALRVYPSLHVEGPPRCREVGLHAGGACSMLCLSMDGRTLITAGDDGALFLLRVSGLTSEDETTGTQGAEEKISAESEAALASKEEIQRLENSCQALMAEHKVLKERIESEAAKLEEECAAKVAEARQKDQAEIQELLRRLDALEKASEAKERESTRIMLAMEASHAEAADQLGNLYERKIEHESDRLLALQIRRENLEVQIQQEDEAHQERLAQAQDVADEELRRTLAEKDLDLKKHQDMLAFVQHRFEMLLHDSGVDHDLQVTKLRQTGRESLEEQKKVEVRLRLEQETLTRGLEMQEKDREQVEDQQEQVAVAVKSLREQAEELKRTLHSLRGEREDRELTVQDKERRIASYQVKEKALKKFKLVLDQRLQEVTQSLQPKDQLITQLEQDLAELEGEFERQLTDQRSLEGQIEQRKQQVALLTAEASELRYQVQEKDATIFRFMNDVNNLVTKQKDLKKWPQEIRRLYHTHVCNDERGRVRLPLEEMQRQMRVVERRVATLANKGMQSRATCKLDIQRKANENAALVHELNELRVHKKSLQTQVRSMTAKLKELEGPSTAKKPALEDGEDAYAVGEQVSLSGSDSLQAVAGLPRPPSSGGVVPKGPSGSLPGPRQRSSSREALHPSGAGAGASSGLGQPPLRSKAQGAVPQLSTAKTSQGIAPDALTMTRSQSGQQLRAMQVDTTSLQHELDAMMRQRG